MKNKAGTPKALAYAFGGAVAIHAAALGSYFAFKSKPLLDETPNPVPQLPDCRALDNAAAGGALKKAAARAMAGKTGVPYAMAFDYSITRGFATVSSVYRIYRYPVAPESVSLEGIPFPYDCKGTVQESLRITAQSARPGSARKCPIEVGNLIGRRFQLLQDEISLPERGGRGEFSSLDMEYSVLDGKGVVLSTTISEFRNIPHGAVNLGTPDFTSVPDCSGSVVFRLPVE